MAKNNKGGVKNAKVNNSTEAQESAVNMAAMITNTGKSSMDRNHQVDLLKMMHETFRMDPDAAEHTGFEAKTIEKLNHLSAIGIAVVFTQEAEYGTSDMAITLRKSCLPLFKEAMAEIGVTVGGTKLLENKTEDGEDIVEVPSTGLDISEETKQALKDDKKAMEAVAGKVYDPTKITNDDELKEALTGLLSVSRDEKLIDNIYKAIAFYLAYKKIVANRDLEKAKETLKNTKDNKYKESAKKAVDAAQKAVDELKVMPNTEVFRKIIGITGRVGLLTYGLSNHLYVVTAATGSPVPAWCDLYSSTMDRKTGQSKYTFEEIAGIVKCLVEFQSDDIRARANKTLEEENALPEKERVKAHIETANKNIQFADKVMNSIVCAPADFVANLKTLFNEKDNKARKAVTSIKKTFYRDVPAEKMATVKIDSLLENCTQYAGIISNLFRDPSDQLTNYSLDQTDHLEFKTQEEINEEAKAAEAAEKEAAEAKAKEDEAKKKAGLKAKAKEEKKKQVKK